MQRPLRIILSGAAALALATACGHDSAAPTAVGPDDDPSEVLAADPMLGAAPGQATLPGLTMAPEATYQGSVSAGDRCTYSASAGRLLCDPVTRNGLTVVRSVAFYDAAGLPQQRRDSTTRSTNTQVSVKGTTTTAKGTILVDRTSSLTVSGLGRGAATHTLNGTESGTTTGSITTSKGTVTVSETFQAATKDVVVRAEGRSAWPLSGTTTRTATTTTTAAGAATRTSTSSEQVTYTGTSIANVVITRNGVTRTCKRDLVAHTLSCS